MSLSESASRLTDQALVIRPAEHQDLPQIAKLLVQLYASELPGALVGPHQAQQALLLFVLNAYGGQGLRRRYVLVDHADSVQATAAIQLPDEPTFERAPKGTIRQALTCLGLRNTAQLLLVVIRSMLVAPHQRPPNSALLHSLVVDERQRGKGLGSMMMDKLEAEVRTANYQTATLQVLDSNQTAYQLYRRRGYQVFWSSPAYLHALTWPTHLMHKPL
ncbi:MAG: GNAT family N-acetyltransferase [Oscillochloris sp.]|nr:GNAT family N-acetyltransferase [Oscillochloris sp.]